jgi:vacuolar-type H+-ATPase subunit I/STV1
MTSRFPSRAVCFLMLFCGACAGGGDRYTVAPGNQGNFSVKRETNPIDSMPRPARDTGPSAREVELQKRIDDLEAKQRSTNAELERLKQEKAKGQ